MAIDIDSYIAELSVIAERAIERADFFATSAAFAQISPQGTDIPFTDAILKDPTYKDTGTLPTQPELQNLSGIALPDTSKSKNVFTEKFPGLPPSFVPPITNNTFSEAYPAKWLIDSIKAAINKLWTETGFESVEIDIWNKGYTRNLQALYDAEDAAIAKYSMTGWSMPNDIIDRAIEDLNIKFDNERATRNADITAKMIDLAQKNSQYAIEQGLNGEAMLVAYFNRFADRSLKAARIAAGKAYDELNAKVMGYNAYLKANEANIKAMSGEERLKLSEYEAILEADTAKLNANLEIFIDTVSNYRTLISAYKSVLGSEERQGAVEMSWRNINFRKNLIGIQTKLQNAISNMTAQNEQNDNSQYTTAMHTATHVHNVAAMLGEMQVLLHEAVEEITNEAA